MCLICDREKIRTSNYWQPLYDNNNNNNKKKDRKQDPDSFLHNIFETLELMKKIIIEYEYKNDMSNLILFFRILKIYKCYFRLTALGKIIKKLKKITINFKVFCEEYFFVKKTFIFEKGVFFYISW